MPPLRTLAESPNITKVGGFGRDFAASNKRSQALTKERESSDIARQNAESRRLAATKSSTTDSVAKELSEIDKRLPILYEERAVLVDEGGDPLDLDKQINTDINRRNDLRGVNRAVRLPTPDPVAVRLPTPDPVAVRLPTPDANGQETVPPDAIAPPGYQPLDTKMLGKLSAAGIDAAGYNFPSPGFIAIVERSGNERLFSDAQYQAIINPPKKRPPSLPVPEEVAANQAAVKAYISAPPASPSPSPPPAVPDVASKEYIVGPRENLSSIAERVGNGVSWQQIAAFNNLPDPDVITPGQVLKIPLTGQIIVRDGKVNVKLNQENLLALANKFGAVDQDTGIINESLLAERYNAALANKFGAPPSDSQAQATAPPVAAQTPSVPDRKISEEEYARLGYPPLSDPPARRPGRSPDPKSLPPTASSIPAVAAPVIPADASPARRPGRSPDPQSLGTSEPVLPVDGFPDVSPIAFSDKASFKSFRSELRAGRSPLDPVDFVEKKMAPGFARAISGMFDTATFVAVNQDLLVFGSLVKSLNTNLENEDLTPRERQAVQKHFSLFLEQQKNVLSNKLGSLISRAGTGQIIEDIRTKVDGSSKTIFSAAQKLDSARSLLIRLADFGAKLGIDVDRDQLKSSLALLNETVENQYDVITAKAILAEEKLRRAGAKEDEMREARRRTARTRARIGWAKTLSATDYANTTLSSIKKFYKLFDEADPPPFINFTDQNGNNISMHRINRDDVLKNAANQADIENKNKAKEWEQIVFDGFESDVAADPDDSIGPSSRLNLHSNN